MAGGDGYDQALVEAMDIRFGPAVLGVEVIKHGKGSIAFTVSAEQTSSGGVPEEVGRCGQVKIEG
jgi:hypothetical protein